MRWVDVKEWTPAEAEDVLCFAEYNGRFKVTQIVIAFYDPYENRWFLSGAGAFDGFLFSEIGLEAKYWTLLPEEPNK